MKNYYFTSQGAQTRDQTSGLINSVAQKNNQGPNIIFSLSLSLSPPCLSWCHQAGSKVSAALPGIASNHSYIWRKKRNCLCPCLYLCLRKCFPACSVVGFPSGFIGRLDLILKQDKEGEHVTSSSPSLITLLKSQPLPSACLPAFPSEFTKAFFNSLAFIAICSASFVHFLFTHTIMSTALY